MEGKTNAKNALTKIIVYCLFSVLNLFFVHSNAKNKIFTAQAVSLQFGRIIPVEIQYFIKLHIWFPFFCKTYSLI